LAQQLLDLGIRVKIIEQNYDVCEHLSQRLPKATIIHGNGTVEQLLLQEGIAYMDAVATLTGDDEDNILISLFAQTVSKAKIITKVSRFGFSQVISNLNLGSVFYPRLIASDITVRFTRALQNSLGSNVEKLYKLIGGKVEALEFRATAASSVCGKALMDLKLRPNLLIGAINRDGKILTPGGRDTIEPGDMVVVVTTAKGLDDLDDILDKRRMKS
jgi:trk system potassium uptake protein TrkA